MLRIRPNPEAIVGSEPEHPGDIKLFLLESPVAADTVLSVREAQNIIPPPPSFGLKLIPQGVWSPRESSEDCTMCARYGSSPDRPASFQIQLRNLLALFLYLTHLKKCVTLLISYFASMKLIGSLHQDIQLILFIQIDIK